jgi:hypothetical protein
MAKKKSKDEVVNFWAAEIKAGERYRDKYGQAKRWSDYRDYYRGEWNQTILPVNRIFSYGRSLIPRVYFRSPRVCATPTRPDLAAHARVVEAIDNWLIKETNLKQTLKRAALHAYLCGTGPIKLGYDSEFGFIPTQMVDRNTSTVTQVARNENRNIEYNVNINPGMPWADPCMPEDIIVPWGAKYGTNLPWIAHRILRPLDDVKADQKYKNVGEIKGTRRARVDESLTQKLYFKNDELKYAELFEIRDMQYNEVIVICEDTVLLRQPDALQVEGAPFEFIIFNEDPEYFWGIPDVRILEPQQLELNETRTQTAYHRRIALLKFLYLKGAIKEEELERFLSGKVGVAVGVDAESLASAISIMQPHIPPDLQAEAQNILNDMRESMGFSENQEGSFSRGRSPRSATEVTQVAQSFEARVNERQDIVADVLERVVRKWNQYIFSFWDQERVIEVVGPGGDQFWVKYTGEELKGEYTLKIDPESGFPVTHQVRLQAMDNLMKTYGGDPLIDQIKLRMMHLEQYEMLHPGISGIIQPPPPQAPPGAAQEVASARQPSPMGSNAVGPQGGRPEGSPGGQRGGGNPGMSPENPMAFERFKEKMRGGGVR